MDSTLSAAATSSLYTLSKTLNSSPKKPVISNLHRHFLNSSLSSTLHKRFTSGRVRCTSQGDFQKLNQLISVTSSATLLRSWYLSRTSSSRLACISNSASPFTSGGGGGGGGGDGFIGGGGGGGGGDGEGELKSKTVPVGTDEVSALSPDVIILDVAGMTCGGCAASVKKILESQPQVSSASVNLATETAIIWPVPEAKATKNWQQQIGEKLANHLTNCGFKSNLRGEATMEGEIPL